MRSPSRLVSPFLCACLGFVGCKAGGDGKTDAKAAAKDSGEPDRDVTVEAKAGDAEPTPEPVAPAEPLPEILASAAAVADAVDPARYRADLEFIAAERTPGSAHWKAVQERCASTFEEAGFTVERFVSESGGTNVLGTLAGSDPAAPAIVVGAHYDHIEGCAGADDNASGTAAVLELARVLGGDHVEGRRQPLILACWDREESGLEGSRAWVGVRVAAADVEERQEGQISVGFYLNFDAMGYADATPNSQRLPPGIDLLFGKELAQLKEREFKADFIAILADGLAHEHARLLLAHAGRARAARAARRDPQRAQERGHGLGAAPLGPRELLAPRHPGGVFLGHGQLPHRHLPLRRPPRHGRDPRSRVCDQGRAHGRGRPGRGPRDASELVRARRRRRRRRPRSGRSTASRCSEARARAPRAWACPSSGRSSA
ncbi:MAG: M28 family peptidase [Myxococcales bacterium]|nr:M28 family peptidase [Myxococcales bacterium]